MYQIEKFQNGLTVVIEPIPYVKSISLGIFVGSGSGNEPKNRNGISHFIEHMNFKGTKNRTAREIAEVLDSVGGKLNAYTSKEHTAYYATVLDEHFDTALGLMSDIFFNSLYRESDIETEKRVVLEEIKMYEDSPDEIIHDLYVRNIWPDFNLGQPVIGTKNVVSELTREDVISYLDEHYFPGNIIISVAGKFKTEVIKDKIKKIFGDVKGKKKTHKEAKLPVFKPGINLINKETEQTHLCFGSRGLSYHDQRRYPLLVLSSIIGGSMSSVLFQEIREKRGLVYSIFSYPQYFKNSGLFTIYAGTGMKNARDVLSLVIEKIEDLKKDFPVKMLRTAKEQLKGNLILGLESTGNKMSWNGKNYFYYEKVMEVEEISKIINKIEVEDLLQLLDYIFNPEFYALTSIGNFKKNVFEGIIK